MKTYRIFGLLLITVTVITNSQSNAQEQTGAEILTDPQIRKEIMKTICKDHEMMVEMMEQMMQNDHALQMMTEDNQMMQNMMSNRVMMMGMMKKDTLTTKMMMENMMHMMESDFVMCKMMGDMMMSNQHMMNMMYGMKEEKGRMMGGRMMGGGMMMCPMHGNMKMSDDIEGEMEQDTHHNH